MDHNISPPDLKFICDQTHKNNTGFCRHYMFLYSLILGMECKNVFEFGSGFSTKCILEALKITGGKLVSAEQRSLRKQAHFFPTHFLTENKDRWRFLQGNSLTEVPKFNHSFYDVVLHDGSHTAHEVAQDINNILPYMKKGSILITHDTQHPSLGPGMANGIKNCDIRNYKHEVLTLPYGYGLTFMRLLESKNNEQVNISWSKQGTY
tara:strand:+ start:567 stop:1187 length:621 start_codon:yes stop_codon:yes gene_type:complete